MAGAGLALVAGCSLVLEADGTGSDALVDGGPGARDCAAQTLLVDSFDVSPLDASRWSEETESATVSAGGGELEITTQDSGTGSRGAVRSVQSFDLTLGELTADMNASTFARRFDAVIAVAALDEGAETATIEAGQIGSLPGCNAGGECFGWAVKTDPPFTGEVPVTWGQWRIRISGGEVLIETAPAAGFLFTERGRFALAMPTGRIGVRLEARGDDTAEARDVGFRIAEVTSAPTSGWCAIDRFDYVAGTTETNAVFEIQTTSTAAVTFDERSTTLGAPVAGAAILRSRGRYDLTGGAVVFEVVNAVAGSDARSTLELRRSSQQRLGFRISNGQLAAYVGGVESESQPYSSTDHAFLRITHGAAADFETSRDGAEWTPFHAAPLTFPVADVELHVRAEGGASGSALVEIASISGNPR